MKIDAVSVWIGGYIMRIQAANTFYTGTYSVLNTKSSFPYAVKVEGYGNTRNHEKLCKKFPEITFNTGSSLMSGNENKVVINLSSECLKKMANDPEFAKKVEFNLTGAVPGQNRMFAQAKADNAVIHGVTTVIDADGNASVTCGGMTRTSGSKQNSTILNAEKKQKERLQKKREERKISEEKAAKRRAEKKAQLEKLTEDETFTISATGTDVKSVKQNLLAAVSGTSAPTGASFDIKA